ncbi:MAG: hypothetical protein SFY66_13095 [Oculatellaceae cyanobacterium bins.114]|nr:hypothetical protein [Oculatellaceae cyanobacterium bins.114]
MSSNFRTTVEQLATGANLSRNLERSDAFTSTSLTSGFSFRSSADAAKAVTGTGRDRIAPRAALATGAVTTAGATNHTFRVVFSDRSGLNRRTIRSGNLLVTGPNGFRQVATLVGKAVFNRPGTRATATYRINAPGGTWDSGDNGNYTIAVLRNKVSDINRNFVRAGALGRGFQVNVVNPNQSPTAVLGTGNLGGNNYTFNITYSDDVAINAGSLDNGDIQVTGPGGFSQFAQFVSVNPAGDGTPRTATYRVNSPGASWTAANNGTYTIAVVANQVSDNAGASVAASNLGTFAVESGRIPPTATVTASNITSTGATTYDFTVTYTDSDSVNASSLGAGDIRITGPNGFNELASFVSVDVNSNGTPRVATYRFNAPGGRWDGPDAGTYTIAMEANQVTDTVGNAVPVGSLGTFDVTIESTAPTATLTAGPVFNLGSGASYITVNYADAAGITPNFGSRNVRVTGPNGYNQFADFVRSDGSGNVTYRINAPGGIWDGTVAKDGTYTVALQAGQVVDLNGNSAQTTIGEFQVRLAPFRVEAETLTLTNYIVEQAVNTGVPFFPGVASNNGLIRLAGNSGTNITGSATTTFSGPAGTYNLVVGYFDENDGISRVQVRVNGALVTGGEWDFDNDFGVSNVSTQGFARRQVSNVQLTPGATIEIRGFQVAPGTNSAQETARVDYIDFVPQSNTAGPANSALGVILGTAGDNTVTGGVNANTVDYSQLANGIIAKLADNEVFKPIYGGLNTARILPVGDSITLGEHNATPTYPGAYRIQLNTRFTQEALDIDYVGSVVQTTVPNNLLTDKEVEAYRGSQGGTLEGLTAIAQGASFGSGDPDVILLMAGSASSGGSLFQMKANLEALIAAITTKLPDTKLLVASIPPTNTFSIPADPGSPFIPGDPNAVPPIPDTPAVPPSPAAQNADDLARTARTLDYNSLISGIVGNATAQGYNVSFVDIGSQLTNSDLIEDGVNLKASGHTKVGNAWYSAIIDKDTLSNIQNVVGTALIDTIVGNANANIIEGGLGADNLSGGNGADTFVYRSTAEGGDTITDFTATDFIQISASGFGGGLVAGTALTNGTASATGTFVNGNTAVGNGPNFLYSGGVLRFDADGAGAQAAVTIATLTGAPALTAARINIVA